LTEEPCGDRGDVDDLSLGAASAHRLDGRLANDEDSENVRLEHRPPLFGLAVEDRSGLRQAGVVDHDIETTSRGFEAVIGEFFSGRLGVEGTD
jgi:hypothetical protein